MTSFHGVYAALLTPRDPHGTMDVENLGLQFHLPGHEGLAGYAIGGATGEFPSLSAQELSGALAMARAAAPTAQLMAGIGAADLRGAILRGRVAADGGANAVLLPMPYFFPYRQDDLRAFALAVADAVPLPVVLYNLPQFTSGLAEGTVLTLLREHENIVGIKDSSGSLDILRAITEEGISCARIVGNDGALCPAMEEGVCDAVVSGVACALPELMIRLFGWEAGSSEFLRDRSLLQDFIAQLDPLPTPWGLKVTSEVRGFTRASYPFPLSAEREAEMAQLREWLTPWLQQRYPQGAGAA